MRRLAAAATLALTLAIPGCAIEDTNSGTVDAAADERREKKRDKGKWDDAKEDKPARAKEDKPPRAKKQPATGAPKPKPTPKPPKRRLRTYAVLRVVDGDTVEVGYRGGVSVRIIGIDTPETVHPTEPVECGGPRASSLATSLLTGQRVRLVFDPSQGRTDAYGRTLAYLEAPGLGDFGLAMVKRGAAAEYTYDTTYARQARYTSAEASAQSSDRGLWGTCGGVDEPLETPEPSPSETPTPEPTETEPPSGGGGNTDPRFTYCYEANDAGYGPYVEGQDPEYAWYDDADDDGIVCEP
jgi:micrococcal nuclease